LSVLVAPPPYTLVSRVNDVTFSQFGAPAPPTKTRLDSLRVAEEEFGAILPKLREVANRDLPRLEKELDAAGIVHKPGRIPDWK
jgi:hypothetical protein